MGGEEPTIDHFKGLMAEIVEKQCFLNAELLESGLLSDEALLVHVVIEQPGISDIVKGSLDTMRRCLQLKKRKMIQVDPGVYSEEMVQNLT